MICREFHSGRLVILIRIFMATLVLALAQRVHAQEFVFTEFEDNVRIDRYQGFETLVMVPETIQGKLVTSIGPQAFAETNVQEVWVPDTVRSIERRGFGDCSELTTVHLPQGLETIGPHAFENCAKLEQIQFPHGLKSIQAAAFQSCASLDQINLPDSLEFMGPDAFANCQLLTSVTLPSHLIAIRSGTFQDCYNLKAIELPDSIVTISENAFRNCQSLKRLQELPDLRLIGRSCFDGCSTLQNVSFGSSLQSIEARAFSNCSMLAEVRIPEAVQTIGEGAFESCEALVSIQVDEANPWFTHIDGVLFDRTIQTLIQFPAGRSGEYRAPASVSLINSAAFEDCSKVTRIRFEGDSIRIGSRAFRLCSALSDIELPDIIHSIGERAFEQCVKLRRFDWPKNIGSVPSFSFSGCRSLCELTLPEGVRFIGFGAFSRCESLQRVVLPSSLNRIEGSAFERCRMLNQVDILAPLKQIPGGLFQGCDSIETIDLPDSVEIIEESAFRECRGLREIDLPSKVRVIERQLFSECHSLQAVRIHGNIHAIKERAFMNCLSLASFEFQPTLISIEQRAFYRCASLRKARLPSLVRVLEDRAFAGCIGMEAIEVDPANPSFASRNGALYNADHTVLLQYPSGKLDKQFVLPSSVHEIALEALSFAQHLESIETPPGHATFLSHDGTLFSKDARTLKLYPAGRPDSMYRVPMQVASIAPDAFHGNAHLVEVVMPQTLETMSGSVFSECPQVTGVYFEGDAPDTGIAFIQYLVNRVRPTPYFFSPANANAKIYFLPHTSGWERAYTDIRQYNINFDMGYPKIPWIPKLRMAQGNLPREASEIEWRIHGAFGQSVQIEVAEDPRATDWDPVDSFILNESNQFYTQTLDPLIPSQYLRARSP